MRITTRRSLAACMLAPVLLAVAVTGCSSGATGEACTKVQSELSTITADGMKAIGDPAKLKAVYGDGADRLRELAKGTDIADETEKVAVALEGLGQQVADAAAGSAVPQVDQTPLTQAGMALSKACT
jgi:hypothetical protein